MIRNVALCALIGTVLGGASTAVAGPLLESGVSLNEGYAIELGGVAHLGNSEFSSPVSGVSPQSFGFVLKDRHGFSARAAMGAIIVLGGAAAASSPKKVERRETRVGRYKIVETKTTYRSKAEQAAIMASAAGAAAGLFSVPMAEFELEVFGANRFGFGESTGHKLNMLFGGGDPDLYFEMGFGWGNVNSSFDRNNLSYEVDHKYVGMPFRIGGAISKVAWALTWEWNWLAHGVEPEEREAQMQSNGSMGMIAAHHPLRIDTRFGLFGKLYGQAGLVFPSVKKFEMGYRLSAGFRF